MEGVNYKYFNKKEEKIYDDAINRLRKALKDGLTFKEACALIEASFEDIGAEHKDLKELIIDDFLKICIVELHYEKNMPLKEIALKLAVSHEDIIKMHQIILEDVSMASLAQYHKEVKGQA